MADQNNVIKGNKGAVLPGRAREIIFNVNKFFENDKHRANELLRDLNFARIQATPEGIPISYQLFNELSEFLKASSRVTERVVQSTGINKNTATRIKREGLDAATDGHRISTPVRKPRGKSIVLDNCDLHALSKLIIKLYMEDDGVPSLGKILERARSELNFQGSMTTLRRILKHQLDYKLCKSDDKSKQLTMTRPNISDGSSSDEEYGSEYLEIGSEVQIASEDVLNSEEELT